MNNFLDKCKTLLIGTIVGLGAMVAMLGFVSLFIFATERREYHEVLGAIAAAIVGIPFIIMLVAHLYDLGLILRGRK